MSEYLITEVNCETGEVIQRKMNTDEAKQREADDAAYAEAKAYEATKAAKRQALLDKLGITEEEARLLLGGN